MHSRVWPFVAALFAFLAAATARRVIELRHQLRRMGEEHGVGA